MMNPVLGLLEPTLTQQIDRSLIILDGSGHSARQRMFLIEKTVRFCLFFLTGHFDLDICHLGLVNFFHRGLECLRRRRMHP